MIKQAINLLTSRRFAVLAGAALLFGLKWRLLGAPAPEDWTTFLAVVAAWMTSESKRRHDGGIVTSRRFVVGALSQVVPALLALLGVSIPSEALAALNGLVASWLLGEGERRHEVSAEDAPPADGG